MSGEKEASVGDKRQELASVYACVFAPECVARRLGRTCRSACKRLSGPTQLSGPISPENGMAKENNSLCFFTGRGNFPGKQHTYSPAQI